MSKEEYITAINEILTKINWIWILDQIYQFTVNMTKTKEDGVPHG